MKNSSLPKALLFVSTVMLLLCCKKSNTTIRDVNSSISADEDVSSLTSIDTGTLNDKLIAYYPFKGNVLDYSGNGHNGNSIGTVTYLSSHKGKPNSALQLGSARIVTDDFFKFQYTDSFSVCMWFTLNTNNSSGRLLSTECPEGNFRVASFGNGVYAWQFGSAQYYLNDTISLNTWNYVVYTFKQGKVRLYKNGVLKYSGINGSTEPLNYCAPFTIGAKASSAYDMWQGGISNLRIYNRILSKAEIKYLFKHE